ncbi:MAG TPA: FAD-dependent oxidoreductase, partial [Candidatus Sumerlaeota bacterium]|nr:FAD-dependent oxidoreductase [Candidatus Sumerlaeota bacterium]
SRMTLRTRPAAERILDFEEVELLPALDDVVSESKRCLDCAACSECMQCVASCGRGAVDHTMQDRKQSLTVGAVILSVGYEKFLPQTGGSFGFNLYPNVLTSIQFERMLAASGPQKGHVSRPSDGKEPRKIAWLQCIGSRDESCNSPWCSSICCMYSTKEAVIAKEHQPELQTHIYYMDIRSFGKNFEQYIKRAEEEYGVVYRHSRIPQVEQNPTTKNLIIRYINDTGGVSEEEYDMVVLSVGIQPCEKSKNISELFQIQLNEYGFFQTAPFDKTNTTRNGVYVAGSISEPKDNPESVTEASCAAAAAAVNIASARGSEVTDKKYPAEKNVEDEEPRVGVFVCHCGTNIGSVVDVAAIVEAARNWDGVVFADQNLYTCSQDAQDEMKKKIREHNINRVVVASCTPRTHEELFQDTIREAGLNPYLFQMANIRDQCSWVHRDSPQEATRKAMDIVRMTVAKAARLYSVRRSRLPLVQKALVIGGGIAGMSAALAIAEQGFDVFLVEKEAHLGGHLREIYFGFREEQPQKLLEETVAKINAHPQIRVFLNSQVEALAGYVGNFTSRIRAQKHIEEVSHGIVVVATGAQNDEPNEYLYGQNENVLTQRELEKALFNQTANPADWKQVAMIQCVGSRNEEHPWCSRVCCSEAIRNALKICQMNPSAQIFILYRDIRTYGFKEDYLYRKAREKGIIFARFEENEPPIVAQEKGRLSVKFYDDILKRQLTLHPDKLVLSAGIVPANNETVAQLLKVPLGSDGFFVEAHAKLRPVDFANDGIYLCGTAHSPRFVDEAITQARAAAARAATVLSKDTLETKGIIVQVNPRKCVGCEVCVGVCAYDARQFDSEKRYVVVNEVLCQGCGACAAACPNGATQQNGFTSSQILSMIDSLFEEDFEPVVKV